ncbi:MAG: helix-turn-helix domain-containing protein [Gemmatimonadetes bacterium]|nr:helix-turn-helix domain-containing protein [Gemmatimonadota bacterium]
MTPDADVLYAALSARDPRFDGVFFVGVTSTGIYCRPVCPARTPRRSHCRFFGSAAAAEHARFRPCLRCRPELAPGNAPVDAGQRIAAGIARRIGETAGFGGPGLEEIAGEFALSSRQVRRIVRAELGVAPIELVLTRRLLLAKQLLTETVLPVGQVAFACGFASLRRFNAAFREHYGTPPTRLRSAAAVAAAAFEAGEPLTLRLSYRPPFDRGALLAFLRARALAGVEHVPGDAYLRTVRLGGHAGWVGVRPAAAGHELLVDVAPELVPVLPALLGRLRDLFDLDARPDVIAARLGQDELLAPLLERAPGLRVPGAFDGFELAWRAILGQQVSVAAATAIAGRVAARFGEPIATPYPELAALSPTAERLAAADVEELGELGVIRARGRSIVALAREVAAGRLRLAPGPRPAATIAQLQRLPGIGPWTAQYIALRALRWPDAFPREDGALRKRLGGLSAALADARSQAWRPWRSYATVQLWHSERGGRPRAESHRAFRPEPEAG